MPHVLGADQKLGNEDMSMERIGVRSIQCLHQVGHMEDLYL